MHTDLPHLYMYTYVFYTYIRVELSLPAGLDKKGAGFGETVRNIKHYRTFLCVCVYSNVTWMLNWFMVQTACIYVESNSLYTI